jgi:hypothetical protein
MTMRSSASIFHLDRLKACRSLLLSICVLFASAAGLLGCPGQTGKIIFSDDFSDDSGGWDVVANKAFAPNALQLNVDQNNVGFQVQNLTFYAVDGDYCAEIAFPSAPTGPNNKDSAGIAIVASDYNNLFLFLINTAGSAQIFRRNNGTWLQLSPDIKTEAIKAQPDSVNAIRVVLKDQKLTFFVNGTQLKVLRAQIPPNANRFGVFVEVDQAPSSPRVFLVKNFNLTDGTQ